MRPIDADKFKKNILSGLYVFCQENKEDIARAIDSEPTVEPDFKLFREWKCTDCEEREKSFHEGWQSAMKRFKRPQGEWFSNGVSTFGFNNPGKRCSLCNRVVEFSENFCPKCGADMRGKNNGNKNS